MAVVAVAVKAVAVVAVAAVALVALVPAVFLQQHQEFIPSSTKPTLAALQLEGEGPEKGAGPSV